MTHMDPETWLLAVEEPEALSPETWNHLVRTLTADGALRRRLVAERQLHERLSRLHDAGRGNLNAVLSHRLTHVVDHPRFVRRVLQRTSRRQRARRSPGLAVAIAAMLVLALGLGFWGLRPPRESPWINGPATVDLTGGVT